MKTTSLLRLAAAHGALAIAVFAAPAFAQDTAPADTISDACSDTDGNGVCDDVQTSGSIVVTGSRIRRPNLESTVPIASISGDVLTETGRTNIGDELNDLPQLRSTFAQSNPGLGIGIAGLNLLDLRGLGTARTLVLVNGRRHVPADINNNGVSPDVNTIPNDLIERVDIVTGGNSAVYGSDAIAGVVNFILKRNFQGFQIRGSTGVAEEGYGGNQYVSALFGTNFGDGRGNVTLHGEYAHQDRVFASDIQYLNTNNGLAVTDIDPAGLVNGSDGIPDRTFLRDIRGTTISRFGLVPVNQAAATPACGVGISNGVTAGVPYTCTFLFAQGGSLVPQTGSRFGTGSNSGIVGGNGDTGREANLTPVLPALERYNFNFLGHYEFAPAAEVFVEAKWNRTNVQGSAFGASFIQGVQNQFRDSRERIRLDNPFLNPADRNTLATAILASNCNTSLTVACGALTAAQRTAIAAGTYRFVTARRLTDVGIRDEQFQRDTYRVVGGLRGTFNTDWNYEISANYGKFKENTLASGFVNKQRFVLSLDAGRNPTTGAIQCRSQFDPASATAYTGGLDAATAATNQARLAADIAACVPYNPFGQGDNSAAAAYFGQPYRNRATLDQLVLSGFVSGDTSGFFNMPGGPVSFAVGAEYRREKSFFTQDADVQAGFTNAVSLPTFSPKPFTVKEVYGELRIPILKDTPFFEELTLSGAGRVAKYRGGTGTVYAYNAGIDYAPIRDIRFRANYSRAVRAPNLSETSSPLVENFAPGFQDPCRTNNIGAGSQFRAANCAADLGALLNDPSFANQNAYSLQVVSGSNPNLTAEKSNSLTVGTVIEPRFIPNLSLSVDYYNIKVNGVITSVSAQNIVNGCYDAPTLSNPFCGVFTRFRGPGTGPNGEVAGQVRANTLIQAPLNFAKRIREGVDVQVNYRTDVSENVKFSTSFIYTHNLQISNFANPTDPTFENRILGELGDPVDEFRWDIDLGYKEFTVGYRMHYIGPMYVGAYEDFNSLGGRAPENADFSDIQKYQEVFYHDLRLEWNLANAGIAKDFKFYAGVNNLFDTHPPLGLTGIGAGSAIYDFRGRNYYAGFRARF